jgi:penicillin amidase
MRLELVRTALFLAIAWAAVLSGRADPQSRSHALELSIPGLRQPVEILVDTWGVPHIFAGNEDDLFLAQGFNAARDRLFQIDLWRRRGLGRLSEVFGPSFIEQDRAARLFLYRGDMEREWRAYSSTGREALRIAGAFAAGINAYIDHIAANPDLTPWEFRRFGYQPARWSAEDVVRIRSHGLTRNLSSEVARAATACSAGLEADVVRAALQPPWKTSIPEGLDPCLPGGLLTVFQLATRSVRLNPPGPETALRSVPSAEEALEGSNNWVIAPAKSATGRGIMANDPHRAYSTPSLRYIAHLAAPGLNVIGGGEPSLPGISIGHNGTIAFGLTIFPIDQEDLYVYELHPSDSRLYRYKGRWEPLRTITEEIVVKGKPAVKTELQFTRHGPVVFTDLAKRRVFAVRSCWLEPGMLPYFRSIESMRARDFGQFRRAMNGWGAPTLNHVYADVKGNIGWIPRGLAPRRPNWDGLLPVPGDSRFEWDGFWQGDDLPQVYNPSQGWFATANQLNLPVGYPYGERKLGFEWTNPSRFQRVSEVLAALPKVSIEDCERLQADILSIPARRLIAMLEVSPGGNGRAAAAAGLLKAWDFRLSRDSAAAALFEVWQARHLRKAFRESVLPRAAAEVVTSTDVRSMIEQLEKTWEPAKRRELLDTTLVAAYDELQHLQGQDPKHWRWGGLHHNLSEHAFSSVVDEATRARINVGPLPKDGGEHTPSQSSYRPEDFRQTNGPSFRIIVDVGNWDNSRAVNHPGQSGDPGSPHYRDLAPLWLEGRYFRLLYSRAAIEQATESRLHLTPGSDSR